MKKNFRDQIRFYINCKFPNKKTKIKLITYSGKKVCNIKLTKDELNAIVVAAAMNNQTTEQFVIDSLKLSLENKS